MESSRILLEKARRDAELHRAQCSFEKKPGGEYHLYRKSAQRPEQKEGVLWFSRIAPDEWITPQPQTFEGTFPPRARHVVDTDRRPAGCAAQVRDLIDVGPIASCSMTQ